MQRTVVIAPDSFKGTLPAAEVADAIAAGWAMVRPDDTIRSIAQADGGEGTLDAIAAAVPAAMERDAGPVTGPDGRLVRGRWLELPDAVAVIELASVSGLPLMERPDPLGAHTIGLGEVMAAALAAGASGLVVALGGSASTDGGAGALSALGLVLADADGMPVPPGGGALGRLASIDASAIPPAPAGGVVLLTDVDAPLLGPRGAAAVFGPQKGATPADVMALDAALSRFATLMGGDPSQPGTGAAGGTAFGLLSAFGGTIVPGADRIAELTGLGDALAAADILITGEGRFDATSLTGKVVGRLFDRAEAHGVDVALVAGRIGAIPRTRSGAPIAHWSLTDLAGSVESAMSDPVTWLREAGRRAALRITDSGDAGAPVVYDGGIG